MTFTASFDPSLPSMSNRVRLYFSTAAIWALISDGSHAKRQLQTVFKVAHTFSNDSQDAYFLRFAQILYCVGQIPLTQLLSKVPISLPSYLKLPTSRMFRLQPRIPPFQIM